jgi:hypothetical protein
VIELGPCNVWDHVAAMFNGMLNCIQIVLVAWLTKRAIARDATEKARNGTSSN